MDQKKIGKFIQAARKEQNLTQRELADKLYISDKTVSRWETGSGLPDVSLMLPLCNALGISVNELLSAQRLDDEIYQKKAEENIMSLIKDRQENKNKLLLSIIVGVSTIIVGLAILLIAGFAQMEAWTRVTLICLSFVVMLIGILTACVFDKEAGYFECKHCKERFEPTLLAYIMGPHTPTKRYLKCPQCGKKSWCKKHLSKKGDN